MKKHLFLLSSVFALLSLQAQEATMMVAANTNVKVKTGTTLYVGGEMKVANYTESGRKISNQGNIKITEKLTNENTNTFGQKDGSNFVNEIAGIGKYGQLIVTGDQDNSGEISSEIKLNSSFVFHSLAVPYEGLTAEGLLNQIYPNRESEVATAFNAYTGGGQYFDENRVPKNVLFKWNINDFYLENLAKEDVLTPETYYAINKNNTVLGAFTTNSIKSIKGVPAKKEKRVQLNEYNVPNSLSLNPVGEYYGSYIFDYTVAMPLNWKNYSFGGNGVPAVNGFGDNIFDLANPYTSNIDLTKLNNDFLSKIRTLIQYTSQGYVNEINEGSASGAYGGDLQVYVPTDNTGDTQLRYVRPFQTFSVKMQPGFSSTEVIFNDNVKTFTTEDNNINILYNRKGDTNVSVNQVGLDVFDNKGNLVSKTYVVASDIYEAGKKGKGTEIYNPSLNDESTAIFTLQEKEDGTIDEVLIGERTYINGVNANEYIAKPIHLVFQNGKGSYTFNARLNEDLQSNKNTFYFEDKKEGKVIKIDENFNYSVNVNGTEKDRFVLYWGATPTEEIAKEVAEESVDTTVVFKDQNTYKVRFDKEMQRADVFVYNISGQLINVTKNINTSQDYVVPVSGNTSVYIIKVIGNNGKIITKKIIK